MSEFKESANELLIVLLSVAALMLGVYFQQSREWNRSLDARDLKISELDHKIAELGLGLARARETITGHEASSREAAEELKSAQQIIGEMESGRQKNQKIIADLQEAINQKNGRLAELDARLSTIKDSTAEELAGQAERIKELENMVGEQKLKLTQGEDAIRRLKASEKALGEKLQTADQTHAELKQTHEKLLEELAALKKEN